MLQPLAQAVEYGGPVEAAREVHRLTPIVNERREKMKDEMMGEVPAAFAAQHVC